MKFKKITVAFSLKFIYNFLFTENIILFTVEWTFTC